MRVSTTGYSAKALGANEKQERLEALLHPYLIALGIGLLFILMQGPIWQVAQSLLAPEAAVAHEAATYYGYLIWGAPFVLINYVLLGWLMGQAKVKAVVRMQLAGNLMNIVLDVLLVKGFGMAVKGVAHLIHPVNLEAFVKKVSHKVPTDGKNLNRVFPGNKEGSLAEQIAHFITFECQSQADFYLDLHGGDLHEQATNFVYYPGIADPEVSAGQRVEAGQLIGVMKDLFGNTLETYYAQLNGVVLYMTITLSVEADEPLIAYGEC